MKPSTALLFILLIGSSCRKVFFKPEPESNPTALFEYLWQDFNHHYGPMNERKIDWQNVYMEYEPFVSDNISDDSLFSILSLMLAEFDDGHVNLIAPNRKVFNSNFIRNNKIDDGLFNLDNIKKNYLEGNFKSLDDNGYVYGTIRGYNLGYIYFDYVADNFFVLNDFLNQYAAADGIIIDMRHNQGGDFTFGFSAMQRLTDQKRLVFNSRTKNGTGPDDFTAWYDWHLEPGGNFFNKPIVVLTDRFTISAGERTVMALKTLPNAIQLGDTTCGAISTMIGREMANGWYYSIATQNTLMFDGKSYEGIGLIPDEYFKNRQEDVNAGFDRLLEKAISKF